MWITKKGSNYINTLIPGTDAKFTLTASGSNDMTNLQIGGVCVQLKSYEQEDCLNALRAKFPGKKQVILEKDLFNSFRKRFK